MKEDNVICRRHEFIIFRNHDGFVVYNTKKTFRNGHTHLHKFNSCISAIKCTERKQIPKNKSKHFLNSILRINNDKEYELKIKDLLIDFTALVEHNKGIDNRKFI